MSVQVRARREAASFLASYVGAQGELLVDTTNNRVQVHDGATPGGSPAAKLSEVLTNTRIGVADAAYTALPTDRTIAVTSLTASRTITLPAASAYPTGTQLLVFDESGSCSATNVITIARAGSDTINAAASASITTAYGYLAFESNGAGRWTIVDQTVATSGTLAVSNGGTGATTANGALLALGAIGRTAVADAAYTALATDRSVAFTSLTAARVVTLPAASAYPVGTQLVVLDESGACSATRTITLASAGSDTINGGAGAIIALAYGYIALVSNGTSRWTIVDLATLGMAQQDPSAVAITGGTISGAALRVTSVNLRFANAIGIEGTLTTGTSLPIFVLDSSNNLSFGAAALMNQMIFLPGTGKTVRFLNAAQSAYIVEMTDSGRQISFGSNIHDSIFTFYNSLATTGDTAISIRDGAARPARVRFGSNAGTYDVGFSRNAAGVLAINDGSTTPSNYRDLLARTLSATASLNLPSYTVASLPAAGTPGRVVFCSNARMQTATAGTLEPSGSGTGGLVGDNGSAWKIVGTNITVSA